MTKKDRNIKPINMTNKIQNKCITRYCLSFVDIAFAKKDLIVSEFSLLDEPIKCNVPFDI